MAQLYRLAWHTHIAKHLLGFSCIKNFSLKSSRSVNTEIESRLTITN